MTTEGRCLPRPYPALGALSVNPPTNTKANKGSVVCAAYPVSGAASRASQSHSADARIRHAQKKERICDRSLRGLRSNHLRRIGHLHAADALLAPLLLKIHVRKLNVQPGTVDAHGGDLAVFGQRHEPGVAQDAG